MSKALLPALFAFSLSFTLGCPPQDDLAPGAPPDNGRPGMPGDDPRGAPGEAPSDDDRFGGARGAPGGTPSDDDRFGRPTGGSLGDGRRVDDGGVEGTPGDGAGDDRFGQGRDTAPFGRGDR